MLGPSVFPLGEPGVSGDFWGSQEGCQGPFRPSGQDAGAHALTPQWPLPVPLTALTRLPENLPLAIVPCDLMATSRQEFSCRLMSKSSGTIKTGLLDAKEN